MIRRSTLVFLSCLSALNVPAISAKGPVALAQTLPLQTSSASQTPSMLVAQADLIEDVTTESSAANVLSIGSRGPAVRSLQVRLKDTGYYSGPIDGIYGLATQRSVRDFQDSQDFDLTGRLDNATWEALESADTDAASDPSADAVADTEESSSAATESSAESPAEDLPPLSEPTAPTAPATSIVDSTPDSVEQSGGGLGRVFGLGLGLVALVASFGVGFFIANRSKEEAAADEGEGWGEIEPDGGVSISSTPISGAPLSGASATPNSQPVQNGQVNGSRLATTNNALSTTAGQMGGTALMGQSDVVDGLIKDLHNPDPTKRRKVIWELGQRGNSLAVNPLVDAMVTADSKEKSLVLAALSEIGIRSLKPMNRALAIALQDENPEVRKNAIRDLTRIYELVVQISQMLGHATEDEDPEVRQTASWALEQLNRIRRTQDVDSTMRAFPGGSSAKPIDLLSSEASIRRSQS